MGSYFTILLWITAIFTGLFATKIEMKTYNSNADKKYKNPDSDLLHYESQKCIVRCAVRISWKNVVESKM